MSSLKFLRTVVILIILVCTVQHGCSHPSGFLEDSRNEVLTVPRIKLTNRITLYGNCTSDKDQLLHAEDFQIGNKGPSTLSASLEFYIDIAAIITCVEIADRGDVDSLSNPILSAGGPGHNWLSVKVNGHYGKGIFVFVRVVGVPIN